MKAAFIWLKMQLMQYNFKISLQILKTAFYLNIV